MANLGDEMELLKNPVDANDAENRRSTLAAFLDGEPVADLEEQGEGGANKEAPQSKEGRIDWAGLKCDNCADLASHVSVDEETIGDGLVIHTAYCDNCFAVKVVGTVWLHWQDGQ